MNKIMIDISKQIANIYLKNTMIKLSHETSNSGRDVRVKL